MGGKNHARRRSDLKILMQHSRVCETSDLTDRVYAFLALARKECRITPDYTVQNTIVHVLIDTAWNIVAFEKSLDILEYASQGRDQLGYFVPSWVPDWTSPSSVPNLRTYVSTKKLSGAIYGPFKAADGAPATE